VNVNRTGAFSPLKQKSDLSTPQSKLNNSAYHNEIVFGSIGGVKVVFDQQLSAALMKLYELLLLAHISSQSVEI